MLSAKQLDELRAIDSPTVANAIEAFNVRDRTVGYTGHDIRCFFPDLPVTVGYAVTATGDSTTPGSPRGKEGLFRLWEALANAPKPAVLVIQNVGPDGQRSCLCGDVMANTAISFGAIALLTSAGVRDLDEVHALGFQFFAPGAVVAHGNFEILDVGVPVTISGTQIVPGDLIHGDQNGVVVIPSSIADKVAEAADRVRADEGSLIEYVRRPDRTLAGLKKQMGL